jgi:hypothetical protein
MLCKNYEFLFSNIKFKWVFKQRRDKNSNRYSHYDVNMIKQRSRFSDGVMGRIVNFFFFATNVVDFFR